MIRNNSVIHTAENDAELVAQTLAGSRDAFGTIVARYQALICSIAYSATGRVSQSEDLAQETFLAAWKQLRQLREPEKLRGWLCGIARNLVNNSIRREGRDPVSPGASIELDEETESPAPMPV